METRPAQRSGQEAASALPRSGNWVRTRTQVLLSWDGLAEPWPLIQLDAAPDFDWILFDTSGRQAPGPRTLRGQPCLVLSAAIEGKGQIYQALADHLAANSEVPDHVALIDEDILLSVSDINRVLHLARVEGLDICSPALSHDSAGSQRWMLRQPSRLLREVAWVELTMPFYRGSLFMAGREQYRGNVSASGIDRLLMPTLQQLTGLKRCAVIDAVMAGRHQAAGGQRKAHRTRSGAAQEAAAMEANCRALIQSRQPELLKSEWFQRVFEAAPAGSPWSRLKRRLGRLLRRWLEEST